MDHLAVSPSELALAAAATIALLARRSHLLDTSGAVAATLLGPALVATGGWWLGAILIAFFLTSSLLPTADRDTPARTAWQVLANGGPALTLGLLASITAQPAFLTGAVASIAAAASDTWGTELGRRFGGAPVSIRTGQRVPAGTSGAVSVAGTAASIVGALVIAALALALSPLAADVTEFGLRQTVIIGASAVLGSALDSVLGGTLQARFRSLRCGRLSDTSGAHAPGHPTRHSGGLRWMTNSVVNLIATTAAGIVAIAAESLLG